MEKFNSEHPKVQVEPHPNVHFSGERTSDAGKWLAKSVLCTESAGWVTSAREIAIGI
jgi:hypothetical protein